MNAAAYIILILNVMKPGIDSISYLVHASPRHVQMSLPAVIVTHIIYIKSRPAPHCVVLPHGEFMV